MVTDNYEPRVGAGGVLDPDGLARIAPEATGGVAVRVTDGPGHDAALARVREAFAYQYTPVVVPMSLQNAERIAGLPVAIGAVTALLAAVTLTHALLVCVRRQRRELAVYKSLGFTRRQVVVAVTTEATVLGVVALAIGIPLGVIVARWGWRIIAERARPGRRGIDPARRRRRVGRSACSSSPTSPPPCPAGGPGGSPPPRRCAPSEASVGEPSHRRPRSRDGGVSHTAGCMPVTWPADARVAHHRGMTTSTVSRRVEGSVTTISWIPSEAVEGVVKAGFKLGVSHYDPAPPDELGPDIDATLDELVADRPLRFANHLRAWAQFDELGHVVACGPPRRRAPRGDQRARRDRHLPRRDGDARAARRAGDRTRLDPLHPDQRRTHRRPDAPPRAAGAVRAVQVARSPGARSS